MSYLSRHEIDDIRPDLDRMVVKVLGNSDSSVRTIVEQCLHGGFDRKRTTEKLADVLDSRRATKIFDRLEDLLSDYRSSSRSRKRGHLDEQPPGSDRRERSAGEAKKAKAPEARHSEESPKPLLAATATAALIAAAEQKNAADNNGTSGNAAGNGAASSPLTTNQIQQMMQNAQREIEDRKRALASRKNGDPGAGLLPLPHLGAPLSMAQSAASAQSTFSTAQAAADKPPPSAEDIERAKKIADLQAQIRARLSGINNQVAGSGIGNVLGGNIGGIGGVGTSGAAVQEKPKPLILDEEGRTVDKTGRAISIPTLAPTLKANIRAKKKEIFNKASQPVDRPFEDEGQQFFDDRIMAKSAVRNKRLLRFHEPGKFQQQAERMRMKAQLEKLQNEISQIARKTGISSATKLALIAPKQDSHADDVPQMEWWDSVILTDDLNTMDGDRLAIRESAITNLIEHPTQMKPPSECITNDRKSD